MMFNGLFSWTHIDFYEVIFLEYEQNRSNNIKDRENLPKPPKALDGKMYILVLQTIMCVIILSVSIIIKTFFTDLYNDTKLFYKENVEDVTTASEILNENDIGATVSVITSSEVQTNATVISNYSSTLESTSSTLAVGGPISEEIVLDETFIFIKLNLFRSF